MDKIAFTSRGPYVGASSIAQEMAVFHNFNHISMSEVLIEAFAAHYGLLACEVTKNKADYRTALQQFGDASGFQADPAWIERCLLLGNYDSIQPTVIEKVRTDAQAAALRLKGFDIVEVWIPEVVRRERASRLGVSLERLDEVLRHPCEQGIDMKYVSFVITGTLPVSFNARYLSELSLTKY